MKESENLFENSILKNCCWRTFSLLSPILVCVDLWAMVILGMWTCTTYFGFRLRHLYRMTVMMIPPLHFRCLSYQLTPRDDPCGHPKICSKLMTILTGSTINVKKTAPLMVLLGAYGTGRPDIVLWSKSGFTYLFMFSSSRHQTSGWKTFSESLSLFRLLNTNCLWFIVPG